MKARNLLIYVALGLIVERSAPALIAADATNTRPSSAWPYGTVDVGPYPAMPDSEVEVTLSVPGDRPRVKLNEDARVFASAYGKVAGTNRFELWLDNNLFASAFVAPAYPAPPLEGVDLPELAKSCFFWRPVTEGKHQFVLKVTTASGKMFASAPLVLEAAQPQPLKLTFLERPKPVLLTTEELNLAIEATVPPGQNATIILGTNESDMGMVVTNGPVLAIHGWKLPAGIYQFEADATDEYGQSAETLSFNCTVDPIERAGTVAPEGLIVEPATERGQAPPKNWYPNWPNKNVRIGGASDALQLRWNPPAATAETAGVLVQRLDPPSNLWKTVAILEEGVYEWRDSPLLPEHAYKYRIAFMCDPLSRTPFGPEAGESTSVPFASHRMAPRPSK